MSEPRTLPKRKLPSQLLRAQVSLTAENRPGIYRFVGPRGEVLYVGKSVRVRSRLLSYFRSDVPSKQSELLRVSTDVEWEYVPNEFEALLREFRQIRAFRPRFNRRHRGERRFAWVKLTGGPAPRLIATRRPAPSHGRHFGPFPAPPLPSLLRKLSVSVGLRDCPAGTPMHFSDQSDLFSEHREPKCSRAELGTCEGPCAGRCSEAEYGDTVLEATRFLDGKTDAPLDRLQDRMTEAAGAMDYELAARLRDRKERLRALRHKVVLFRDYLAALSFLYRVPTESDGPDQGYALSGGRVLCSFRFDCSPDHLRAVRDHVRTALRQSRPTPDGMDAETREEIFLVARWFRWKPEERARSIPFQQFLAEDPTALASAHWGHGPTAKQSSELGGPQAVSSTETTRAIRVRMVDSL